MKITKEYNSIFINFTKDFFIELKQEWSQLWGKYNWISMNFLHLYFENDKMTGGYEFEFMVLGVGLRVRYNYNDTLDKMSEQADKEIKEYLNK